MEVADLTLRSHALASLAEKNVWRKIDGALAMSGELSVNSDERFDEPMVLPGRPESPRMVQHTALKQRSVSTKEGRGALIHALAHIELNAVDLALDIIWRFSGMPREFYIQWAKVAQEEAHHFSLLSKHLQDLGYTYGDFDAHNGLWEMAEKTKGDVLARIALVPRTLEARGLDASPAVKAKLLSVGDHRGGEILDVILRDEIGHVALGNHWFRWLCERERLDPIATFAELVVRYEAPRLRGPFNVPARRAAGFTPDELEALTRSDQRE